MHLRGIVCLKREGTFGMDHLVVACVCCCLQSHFGIARAGLCSYDSKRVPSLDWIDCSCCKETSNN